MYEEAFGLFSVILSSSKNKSKIFWDYINNDAGNNSEYLMKVYKKASTIYISEIRKELHWEKLVDEFIKVIESLYIFK